MFNLNFGLKWYFKEARLFMKKRYSNFIMTLTDLDDRLIFYRTAGMIIKSAKRKPKVIPDVVVAMFDTFLPYIKLYNLKAVEIVLKMRAGAHFRQLLTVLSNCGIGVTFLTSSRYLSLILVNVEKN